MKKRVLALMMAGMMVFGCSAYVYAEEAAEETTEEAADDYLVLSMDDMDTELYDGTWLQFVSGFDIYLPSDWNVLEITDENADAGIVFQAQQPDSPNNMVVSCTAAEEIGEVELPDIQAELSATEGYSNVMLGEANGIGIVTFDIEEMKVSGVAFLGESGNMYTIQIGLTDDEELLPIAANLFYSLSPSEEEAAE